MAWESFGPRRAVFAAAKNSLALSTLFHSSALCYTGIYFSSSSSSLSCVCSFLMSCTSVFSFKCSARSSEYHLPFLCLLCSSACVGSVALRYFKRQKGTSRKNHDKKSTCWYNALMPRWKLEIKGEHFEPENQTNHSSKLLNYMSHFDKLTKFKKLLWIG